MAERVGLRQLFSAQRQVLSCVGENSGSGLGMCGGWGRVSISGSSYRQFGWVGDTSGPRVGGPGWRGQPTAQ